MKPFDPGGPWVQAWPMTLRRTRVIVLLAAVTLACAGCQRCRPEEGTGTGQGTGTAKPKVVHKKALEPIIDSHVHITPLPETMNLALQIFSQVGVTKFAVKSAGVPGTLRYQETVRFARIMGDRMAFFSTVDWDGIDDPGWGKREADQLELAVRDGASGIKIFKALGLGVRLANDKLLRIDDKRLEPIWQRAGKVGAIIAWHVADPVAFFKPVDKNNERYEELSLAPEWSFHGKDFPGHDELLAQRDKVVASHPKTTFLGIHLANYPENIDYVADLLDRCPNMYVDVSARLGEIGRHPPEKVRAFFIKYQDRILFGTDLIVTPNGMQLGSTSENPPTFKDALKFYADHRHFFETADRNIDHPTPVQGRWKVNAINLPPEVLRKFYVENAERLIFKPRSAWLREREAGGKPR
jgi:predicted TIM-barrel fold metal-dependent hydrolase